MTLKDQIEYQKSNFVHFVVFMIKGEDIAGVSRHLDHVFVPTSMDDSQIVTLQGDWQGAEELEGSLPDRFVGKYLRNDLTIF